MKLECGYLVSSLNNPNQWFLFKEGGLEVEILKHVSAIEGVDSEWFGFNKNVHWKDKHEVINSIKTSDGFLNGKKEWEKIVY